MAAQAAPLRRKRILIVDDEPDSGDMLAQCLGAQYDVLVARDGVEGIEQAARYAPDLIISDVAMPRLGGLAMVQELRRKQGSKVPVIFLSAYTSPSDIIAGITVGARQYLTKPVELTDLKKRLARVFGQ